MSDSCECKNIVITGGNRGLGLELVKQILTKFKPEHLIATYRNPETAEDLLKLASEHVNLHPVILDVRATEKYADFVQTVDKITEGAGVNLLINNSGVQNMDNNHTLSEVTKDDIMYHFEVNTVAPIMLTQAFLPLLEKASANGAASEPLGIRRAAVVHLTSRLGSITMNSGQYVGPLYSYRISKADLKSVLPRDAGKVLVLI